MSTVKRESGLTIIEVVIVIALFGLLIAVGLPFGIDSYRNYLLTSETRNAVSILRRAQNLALANTYESSYGVALQEDGFILFQGTSFVSRNPGFDETYIRSSSITVSGLDEIVFLQISGSPIVSATTTLSNGVTSQKIYINEHGTLYW